MSDETVFPGRKQARAGQAAITACFAAFTFGYVAFAVYIRGPLGFGLGGLGLALFGTIGAFSLGNLLAACSTVRLDAQGLSVSGPGIRRRVEWKDIREVTAGVRETRTIKLHTDFGVVRLRLGLIEDGEELGRLIRARVPAPSAVQAQDTRTYRRENFLLLAFMAAVLLFLLLGMGLLAVLKGGARALPSVASTLVLSLVYAPLLLIEITRFARIGPSSLTLGNLFSRKSVLLGDIERIEVRAPSGRGLKLMVRGKWMNVPAGLEGGDDLRARLLAVTGLSVERRVEPVAAIPTGEPETFGPKKGFWGQFAFIAVMGGVMTSLGPIMIFDDPDGRLLVMGIGSTLLFGTVTVLGLISGVMSLSRYRVDEAGIERSGPLKPWRISWDRISASWMRGQYLTTLRLIVDGKPVDIDLSPLGNPQSLVATVQARVPQTAATPAKFANRAPLVLCGIGALLAALGCVFPDRGTIAFFGVVGLLLALLGYALGCSTYETTAEGLWVRRPRKRRCLKFEDVKRLEIDTRAGKNGQVRSMTLEHPEGGVTITSGVQDFSRLESFVRAHLDAVKIHDATGG